MSLLSDTSGGSRLQQRWDLLRELTVRELKIRYKRSYLGIGWSLLNPLSQLLIFSFLFGTVVPLNIPHYTAFVFTGVLAWSWFSSALTGSTAAIGANTELVRRPGFPVSVLPLLTVASNGIHYVLALPVLLLFAYVDSGGMGLSVTALPLVMIVQFVLTLGLVYLTSAAFVYFRDVQHLLLIFVMLGFYMTPVFYRANNAPEEIQFLYTYNPMAVLLEAYREILIQHRWPDFSDLAAVLVFGLAACAAGYAFFNRAILQLVDDL